MQQPPPQHMHHEPPPQQYVPHQQQPPHQQHPHHQQHQQQHPAPLQHQSSAAALLPQFGDVAGLLRMGAVPAAPAGFPYVLSSILEHESPDIITWSSTGRAFGIRNMSLFKTRILPQYFKHDKFSSFQRQLNLYGFRKIVKGRESGCYIHMYFQRGHPELLKQVRRGQVPPCPPKYERKVYGCSTRPRTPHGVAPGAVLDANGIPIPMPLPGHHGTSGDTSDDDSCDSEPEMRRAFDPLRPHSHPNLAAGGAVGPFADPSAPWDGSFQQQEKTRRENSTRRVNKLFGRPGGSAGFEPVPSPFGFPPMASGSSSGTASFAAPSVNSYAYSHTSASYHNPYGGSSNGGGGGMVRGSFCAMLGALENELRMTDALGQHHPLHHSPLQHSPPPAAAAAAAAPAHHSMHPPMHHPPHGHGGSANAGGVDGAGHMPPPPIGNGAGAVGAAVGDGVPAHAPQPMGISLLERPGFGGQLLDVAYELRESRSTGAGAASISELLSRPSLSAAAPAAPAATLVGASVMGGGRGEEVGGGGGGGSSTWEMRPIHRSSMMELLRTVEQPPAKRQRQEPPAPAVATAAPADAAAPIGGAATVRHSIVSALVALNQDEGAGAGVPLTSTSTSTNAAGDAGAGSVTAGGGSVSASGGGALGFDLASLWPESLLGSEHRRSTLGQWMDSYFLDNAITDLEASLQMAPTAVRGGAAGGGADAAAAGGGLGDAETAALAADDFRRDSDTARLRGSVFVLLHVLAEAQQEEEGALAGAAGELSAADIEPTPMQEEVAMQEEVGPAAEASAAAEDGSKLAPVEGAATA